MDHGLRSYRQALVKMGLEIPHILTGPKMDDYFGGSRRLKPCARSDLNYFLSTLALAGSKTLLTPFFPQQEDY